MKEYLHHGESVFKKISFPVVDLTVPGIPEIFIDQIFRDLVIGDEVVHAGDDHIFIMRPVEYADLPAPRQSAVDAPHIVMVFFLARRRFEGNDFDPVRVEMGKYAADIAVLPGGIHGLHDHHETIGALRVELRLEQGQVFENLRKIFHLYLFFIDIHIAAGGAVFQMDDFPRFRFIPFDIDFSCFIHSHSPS